MKILLIIYSIIMTALAIPTIQVYYEQVRPPEIQLEAGLSDEQWKFLQDIAKLIEYAEDLGYKLTAGEMYRTMYQQRYYVTHGLSWTYNSKHLKRLAFDVNLFIDGKYQTSAEAYRVLGEYWKQLDPEHNVWGGEWVNSPDAPHFERR